MPPPFADPNSAALATSEEVAVTTLGSKSPNTFLARKNNRRLSRWQALFHSLPNELHVNIAAHLYTNPVSQICLGLTSRRFHEIFHEVIDVLCRETGERMYNSKRYPFDLRMQVSVCEQHVLHGWTEFWFLEDSTGILWERPLGDLIAGEEGLWRGLQRCDGCFKYKHRSAFERFEFEEQMARKHEREIDALEVEDVQWYEKQCRRCRAKILLLFLEKRGELLGAGNPSEERKSLGLLTSAHLNKMSELEVVIVVEKTVEKVLELQDGKFESWEDIFARLQI